MGLIVPPDWGPAGGAAHLLRSLQKAGPHVMLCKSSFDGSPRLVAMSGGSVLGKVSGAWVLKGTRMPVSAIFENLEAGASLDEIMQWYDGLDREQVRAVIEFAARSLDKAAALELYARLEKTQPGSEESNRISAQIIDAIG
jgi:uncharacterized protein (DUF433 family)